MGPQFHETGYGRTFFQSQLPRLIKAIERLADAIEKNNLLPKQFDGKTKTVFKALDLVKLVLPEKSDNKVQRTLSDLILQANEKSIIFKDDCTEEEIAKRLNYDVEYGYWVCCHNITDRTYQFSWVEDILKVVEAKNIIESDPNLENPSVYNLYPECEGIITVNIVI